MTIFYICFCFQCLLLMVAVANYVTKPIIERQKSIFPEKIPSVSILIPARNEAHQISATLKALQETKKWVNEILVLNDQSTDQTAPKVLEAAKNDNRIVLIEGKTLPPNWLGKHWACHQLAQNAHSDYLLFLDADVYLNEKAISTSVAYAQINGLSLLSIFPFQIMKTQGEKLVTPIMHWLLLSLLPLWFIKNIQFASMAAANGQFMLFDRMNYQKNEWHKAVKNSIVDDIAIMQLLKKRCLNGMTFTSTNWVKCHMYHSFTSAIDGFSKNLLSGFGNNIIGLWLFIIICCFCPIYLIIVLPKWALALILLQLLTAVFVKKTSGEKLSNIFFWPFTQLLVLPYLAFKSTQWKLLKKGSWKGRSIYH